MKVVLDTNVLISARIARDGNPAEILKHILEHGPEIELLTSIDLLAEVRRVFHYRRIKRKYHLDDNDIALYLGTVEEASTLVQVETVIAVIDEDPDDDRVLACAYEGEADYIVSGDPHLLGLQQYEGIKIISPRDFLALLQEQQTHDDSE